MKKVLLHICCGVCAAGVVEKLRQDGYKVVGFFYNPNIYPAEEYARRLEVVREASRLLDFDLIEGSHGHDLWLEQVKGLEEEKEGGRRCSVCFQVRLRATLDKAREMGIAHIATTLSVSPHKNVLEINKIGSLLSEGFLTYDFKKEDGFKKTMDFAKLHDFYRQQYCGCEFSIKGAQ
jgi:predicted adenine nucleotide alpha hydrolase (AANH) superfamily ATPase